MNPPSQLRIDQILSALDGLGLPTAFAQLCDQPGCANAAGTAIDQMRERFGVEAALSPVAQDHGGGGTAAKQFGL